MTLTTRRHRFAAGAVAIGVIVGLGLAPLDPASADEYDDRRAANESSQQALDQAIASLESELAHTDATLVRTYAELQVIEGRLPGVEAELAAAEERLAVLQREATMMAQRLLAAVQEEASIADQVAVDTRRAEETRDAIGQMARDAYKGDIAASALSAVLDAHSTDEFVEQSALADTALRTQTQALRELEQINGLNRNRGARLTAVREQVTSLKAQVDANVVEADVARADTAARKMELEQLRDEQRQKAAAMESQKAEQITRQAELEAQQATLETDLAQIIRAQDQARAAGNAGRGPVSGGSRPFANPTSFNPWVKTSDYGMRFHPVLQYWRLHAGLDLRSYCGTPLYAAASGTVEWAKSRGGYGNQVMINHGYWNDAALMSSYNHMTSFTVSAGQQVTQGQLIGYAGNTGLSGACHLHLEAYVNGTTTDPEPMLQQ